MENHALVFLMEMHVLEIINVAMDFVLEVLVAIHNHVKIL